LAQRKENGGLGIPDLRDLSIYLLAAWVQRYYNPKSRLSKDIVDFKYKTSDPNLFCCDERNGSPF
jgi:hypothetical protein